MKVEISSLGTKSVAYNADKNKVLISDSLLKVRKCSRRRSKVTYDRGNLKDRDIQDALELSIAASEALVISGMFSDELISDTMSEPAAVLEIALRVKQARNISNLDMLGMVSDLSANAFDETDLLSDLDEAIMASAYEDIGLSIAQPVKTPDHSLSLRKSYNDGPSYGRRQFATHISSIDSAKPGPCFKMMENDQDNNSRPQFPDPGSSMIRKKDSLPAKFKVDTKQRIRSYFIEESSFISEFSDMMNEYAAAQQVDGLEIVGSSSTPVPFVFCGSDSQRTIHDKAFPSEDPFVQSNLEVDPLCSIVPCSLPTESSSFLESSENHFISSISSDAGKLKAQNPTAALPSESLTVSKERILSTFENEGFGKPSDRHLKSLKLFSTLTPCQQKTNTSIRNKETLLTGVPLLFQAHEDAKYLRILKQDTSSDSFNSKANILEKSGSSKFHMPRSRIDLTEKPTAVGETRDEGFDLSLGMHNERTSPLILKTNSHCRVTAYESFPYSDYEDKNSDGHATTSPKKRKLNHADEGIASKDDAALPGLSAILNNKKLPKKRVRFLEAKDDNDNDSPKVVGTPRPQFVSSGQLCKREVKLHNFFQWDESRTRCSTIDGSGMIFQRFEFLLTGYSSHKEKKLESMIRKFGGSVLSNIPSYWTKYGMKYPSWKLAIILSPRKIRSTKFLCGCAINAWTVNANWLFDSIEAGSVLHPGKYTTRFIQSSQRNFSRIELLHLDNLAFIFDKVGIMPYGKAGFVIKYRKIIKEYLQAIETLKSNRASDITFEDIIDVLRPCGDGEVYKSLHQLVEGLRIGKLLMAVVVVENKSSMPRHLKHCALEHNLRIESASWIIDSLFAGKML